MLVNLKYLLACRDCVAFVPELVNGGRGLTQTQHQALCKHPYVNIVILYSWLLAVHSEQANHDQVQRVQVFSLSWDATLILN